MNTSTKIHLSTLETELIQNKEWILTKRTIIEKVYLLFGSMHVSYKEILKNEQLLSEPHYKNLTGKISKGENYHGLPYVILDYPALFSKEDIFAVRTMFWWGNFFSISLHLSGKYCQTQNNFFEWLTYLQERNFFICINENQWHHTFEASNYVQASMVDELHLNKIANRNFLKISKKLEVNKWKEAPQFLEKTFLEIIEFLKLSFPIGEKDL